MFDDKMISELKKPLDTANIKGREQGGRSVSYIEGWHAIAEANRLFDFQWSRETIYCREISRIEVKIGKEPYKKDGYKVGYEAKVRVTVGDIVKEGTGHGSGTMSDLYDCIESAAKEAETDAMKRALMMFGNLFGLALYDKDKRNVEDYEAVKKEAAKNKAKVTNEEDAKELHSDILSILEINKAQGKPAFLNWWNAPESKADRAMLKSLNIRLYDDISAEKDKALLLFSGELKA